MAYVQLRSFNVTAPDLPRSISNGQGVTFDVIADDGYIFESESDVRVFYGTAQHDPTSPTRDQKTTISEDKKTVTVQFRADNPSAAGYIIKANVIEIPKTKVPVKYIGDVVNWTCDNKITEYTEGTKQTLVFSSINGFAFSQPIEVSYVDASGITQTLSPVQIDPSTNTTTTIVIPSTITIQPNSEITITVYTKNENVINIAYEGKFYKSDIPLPTEYKVGETINIIFTATDYCLMGKGVDIYYTDINNTQHHIEGSKPIIVGDAPLKAACEISGLLSPEVKPKSTIRVVVNTERIDVAVDFKNFRKDERQYYFVDHIYMSSTYGIEEAYHMRIASNYENPHILVDPYIEYTNTEGEVVKGTYTNFLVNINDIYEYEFIIGVNAKIKDIKNYSTIIFHASCDYSYAKTAKDISNCILTPEPPAKFKKNDKNVDFTLTANEGYIFPQQPFIEYYDQYNDRQVIKFDRSPDKRTATGTLYGDRDFLHDSTITIIANAILEKPKEYSLSTIYNPTDKELYQVNTTRFYPQPSADIIDLGQYIINLKKIFLKVPKIYKSNVYLGYYDTSVVSYTIDNPILEVSLGKQLIKGNYDNSLDYSDATVELHLPYSGIHKIDPYYVMNKTIEIVYKVNLYECNCLIEVRNYTSDTDYTVILQYTGVIAMSIPYIAGHLYTPNVLQGYDINELSMSDIKPCIRIYNHHLVPKDEKVYGITTTEFSCIGERTGYFSIVSPKIEDDMNLSEKLLLEGSLKNGVIIK